MFTACYFTLTKIWKQPKPPSTMNRQIRGNIWKERHLDICDRQICMDRSWAYYAKWEKLERES